MPGNEKIHSLTEAFLWFLHGLRAATAAFSSSADRKTGLSPKQKCPGSVYLKTGAPRALEF
jgi:hypothetical protein